MQSRQSSPDHSPSQPRRSTVAPSRLSNKRPAHPVRNTISPLHTSTAPSEIATSAITPAGRRSEHRARNAHAAIGPGMHSFAGGKQERPSTENLPKLRRHGICRSLRQRRQRRHEKWMAPIRRTQSGNTEIRRHLRCPSSALLLCGPHRLFALAPEACRQKCQHEQRDQLRQRGHRPGLASLQTHQQTQAKHTAHRCCTRRPGPHRPDQQGEPRTKSARPQKPHRRPLHANDVKDPESKSHRETCDHPNDQPFRLQPVPRLRNRLRHAFGASRKPADSSTIPRPPCPC